MMPDNYTRSDMILDFKDIKEHIKEERLQGAAITILIDDVLEHYEVATRCKFNISKGHYRDLLSRLVKTYGH
jgi:6-pyruvoyl-tetrahydropterin synthase